MVTPIAEEELKDFQEFEKWLDEKSLLDSNVLYRGHADSTWRLESTLYRHQEALFHARHPSLNVPISKYTDTAKKVQAIVETHTHRKFGDINERTNDYFPTVSEQLSFQYAVYLRHHGFPSPLLDWSSSPYVAAYFAFSDVANQTHAKEGAGDSGSRAAIYVLRPPRDPYEHQRNGSSQLLGQEGGIRYWPNAVRGETRHYDQQSAVETARPHTTALRCIQYDEHKTGVHCYSSHEYILCNFPEEVARGTNRAMYDNTIDGAVCWKLSIPQRDCERVLRRLDQMNINAYTLFRTEDALVKTYGLRELRRLLNTP